MKCDLCGRDLGALAVKLGSTLQEVRWLHEHAHLRQQRDALLLAIEPFASLSIEKVDGLAITDLDVINARRAMALCSAANELGDGTP